MGCEGQQTSAREGFDSHKRSIKSVPFDAVGSMSSQSGTISLTLVVQVMPNVSLATMRAVAMAVNNFEFAAIPNRVYSRVSDICR
jgi:hypothetical protein